jgi:hypothetical protein
MSKKEQDKPRNYQAVGGVTQRGTQKLEKLYNGNTRVLPEGRRRVFGLYLPGRNEWRVHQLQC